MKHVFIRAADLIPRRTGGSRPAARLLIFAQIFLIFSCASVKDAYKDIHGVNRKDAAGSAVVTMIAAGDNLIHKEIINAAKKEDGGFDFYSFYSEVAGTVRKADIAFINQETLIAGEAFEYSGYPRFNGPQEIGGALLAAGFNVINHATNHAMDKGAEALLAVIDYWQSKPAALLGIHKSQEERNEKKIIININGIKFGFLAYTYGLNGIPLPHDMPYLVSLIDKNVMEKEIDAMRPLCDILVVSMHWGNEYEYTPNKNQNELALFLAEREVDLVIGHHPHVLQPVKIIKRPSGAPMICYFSLGNFLSAQDKSPRMLGGMMRVKIIKELKSGRTYIKDPELLPLVTHYTPGYKSFKIYFLDKYTGEFAKGHGLNKNGNIVTIEYFINLAKSILEQ